MFMSSVVNAWNYFNVTLKNETMKRILTLCTGLAMAASMTAQDAVKLLEPDLTHPATLMEALAGRHSTRAFATTAIPEQLLADMLWAANGVNRPDTGKRTAPSAMNLQEIDVYVVTAEGTYRYDAANHALVQVCSEDLRHAVAAGQKFAATAPVCLVLVADFSKYDEAPPSEARIMAAIDAGIVSQNISLFCSATGLATVPRASMDAKAIARSLRLNETQMPLLNHPVGYPAQ